MRLRVAKLWFVFVVSMTTVAMARVFKMGLLIPWDFDLSYDFSGYTSASAVTIAIEKVNSDPSLNANGRIELRLVAVATPDAIYQFFVN